MVFRPLGQAELRQILDIELHLVQQRIFDSAGPNSFVFTVSEPAKEHLLTEGTDLKYGARHLRRAIERLVVQPLSNLIATDQIRTGDLVRMDFGADPGGVTFRKEAEGMGFEAMAEMTGVSVALPLAAASGVATETVRAVSALLPPGLKGPRALPGFGRALGGSSATGSILLHVPQLRALLPRSM